MVGAGRFPLTKAVLLGSVDNTLHRYSLPWVSTPVACALPLKQALQWRRDRRQPRLAQQTAGLLIDRSRKMLLEADCLLKLNSFEVAIFY